MAQVQLDYVNMTRTQENNHIYLSLVDICCLLRYLHDKTVFSEVKKILELEPWPAVGGILL